MALISYLTAIRFDEGAVADIGGDLAALSVSRPMIVSDRGVAATGLLDRLLDVLPGGRALPVFVDVPGNPTEAAARDALEIYAEADCDGLVAMGGGSSIDLAKAVALMATHEGPLARYAAILGGRERITDAVAPVIAVPTTAGTGSEVGRAALITLADGRKLALISDHLIPRRAVCDPELTYSLPPRLTAATGMDAVTHCIETFLSPLDNPPAEAIALDGLARALAFIERAHDDGTDEEARREMMMASLQGGLTFQKGLGLVHALSHPLGAMTRPHLHHGMLNAVILPAALRFNEGAARAKFARLRAAMTIAEDADIVAHMAGLCRRLGLPGSLSEMGVPPEAASLVVEGAMQDHSLPTNARPCSREDVEAVYLAAWNGEV